MCVEMIGGDLRVRTETVQSRPPRRTAAPAKKATPKASLYNKGSRRRLRNAVRGMYQPNTFLTLTFPAGVPTDQAFVRRCWDRMRRWLLQRGASGVMAIEFTARGIPHFHVVLDLALGSRELAPVWAKILGTKSPAAMLHGVTVSWVHSTRKLASYMAKAAQKTPPPGFEVVRWWSSFGAAKPTKPKLVLRGPRAPLESFLQRLWAQRPDGRPPRTVDGILPPRFWVAQGVDKNWSLLKGLGLVE